MKKVLSLMCILLLLAGCAPRPAQSSLADLPLATEAPAVFTQGDQLVLLTDGPAPTESPVVYGQDYDDKDQVALYLHLYGELPPHFITKEEARKLGWNGGEVENYRQGAAIGGDFFGNYEDQLPRKKGRTYYECDIGTVGKRKRGDDRIIYSNDGLIYFTGDHYNSFTLLYGEE